MPFRFCCSCLNCHKANNALQPHRYFMACFHIYLECKPLAEISDAYIITLTRRSAKSFLHNRLDCFNGRIDGFSNEKCTKWKWHNLVYLIEQTKCGDEKKKLNHVALGNPQKKTNTKFRSRFSVFIEKKVYAMDEKSHKSCFYGNKVEETVLFSSMFASSIWLYPLYAVGAWSHNHNVYICWRTRIHFKRKLNPGLFGWCVCVCLKQSIETIVVQ